MEEASHAPLSNLYQINLYTYSNHLPIEIDVNTALQKYVKD